MNTSPEEGKLLKSRIELMTRSAFLASICMSVHHRFTEAIPTAATDNKNILYNPEFVGEQTVSQLTGLVAHECWHIAFQHLARRGSRDPKIWNYAGDHVINLLLLEAGFELPNDGLHDPVFAGLSTDEVYERLLNDPSKRPAPDHMFDITGDGFDLTPDEATAQAEASMDEIRDILVRASTQARMSGEKAGHIPGEVERLIDELINPKLPWPFLMQRFLTERIKNQYTYNRRNRRYSEVFLPSKFSYGLSHVTWAIDTSGSQTDEELRETLSEIQGVRDTLQPEKMTIIDCDARIHNVYEIDQATDILSLKFTGNGGTSFRPVFDYIEDHPTNALVYFTDLHGDLNMAPANYPVMWICNSDHAPAPFGETIYI